MSLVNDMLRDLDARRRDAPVRGLGAEKLVPAAGRVEKKGKTSSGIVVLVLAIVLAGLAALYFVMMSPGAVQVTSPVQPLPTAESTPVYDVSEPGSDVVAQAAAAAAETVAQVTNQTFAQLEQRLQQLEDQNRALLASQQQTQPADAPASPPPQISSVEDTSQTYNQAWADAPALTEEEFPVTEDVSQAAISQAAMSAAPTESSSSRSPRALSFQDRERQQVQLALQQWASGQQLTALQTLDSFAYEYPDAHSARETLAKLLIQQGETERAMQAVEFGLALAPNHNAYRKVKARLLVADARAQEAVILLSDFAPAVTADAEYHDLLASSYLGSQQYGFAEQTYRSLLQLNASEGRWWYGLAAALDFQGLSQDAAAAYERALQQANLSAGLRQTSQQRLQLIRQSSAAR